MDSLFDEVSRILAQPRPRRSTLRIVIGTAAGAAIGAILPGQALAWAPIPCGHNPITGQPVSCSPDQGMMCCNSTTGTCCQQGHCLDDAHQRVLGKSVKVCCPDGQACGDICCALGETCSRDALGVSTCTGGIQPPPG
jgi:hypothetical protein